MSLLDRGLLRWFECYLVQRYEVNEVKDGAGNPVGWLVTITGAVISLGIMLSGGDENVLRNGPDRGDTYRKLSGSTSACNCCAWEL